MICVSLANQDILSCLHQSGEFPIVEIRLDLCSLDTEQIALIGQAAHQWVTTCRPGTLDLKQRIIRMAAAIKTGAAYADLEYESPAEYKEPLIRMARKEHCKIIISWHDFEGTPDEATLDQIILESRRMGADLVKIVPTIHTPGEAARVMNLYQRHSNLIAFGMGETGKISRIAAPLLGAPFTYACASEKTRIAPGQLTYKDLKTIYSKILS